MVPYESIMPFKSDYPKLGCKIKTRVVESCIEHFEEIQKEYNRICEAHGEDYLNNLKSKIILGLKAIETPDKGAWQPIKTVLYS